MADFIDTLAYNFSFPIVRYALIVAVCVSVASSLLGVTLVLKRFSFIGDGLSHTAFGSIAIATILKLANVNYLVMPLTVVCAIFLLKMNKNSKSKGDSSLAMISVTSMALGYFLLSVFSKSANISGDVCSTLFGSTAILTLKISDVILSVAISVVVVAMYFLYYHKIFAVTFDEDFAQSCGVNVEFYNIMIAVITALVIVMAMNFVGSLLITALVVFPALTAMQVMTSFKRVIAFAAILAVIGSVIGILISIVFSTPTGSTVVMVYAVFYLVFMCIGKVKKS